MQKTYARAQQSQPHHCIERAPCFHSCFPRVFPVRRRCIERLPLPRRRDQRPSWTDGDRKAERGNCADPKAGPRCERRFLVLYVPPPMCPMQHPSFEVRPPLVFRCYIVVCVFCLSCRIAPICTYSQCNRLVSSYHPLRIWP